MLKPIIYKFQYGQHVITLETNIIARQSTASVMVNMSDTTVFVTVVVNPNIKLGQNFLPLIVNYQERTYAAGRFPGGFFRREGRPSEIEILIARLIDRPIRPLFPKNFLHEVQIIATVVSINPQINPDIVAIIGVSAALSISGIPFNGPIGAARIAYIHDQYVLNPTKDEMFSSKLDLVVSGNSNSILMVESESKLLDEEKILNAIIYGYHQQQIVIENIIRFSEKVKKPIWKYQNKEIHPIVEQEIKDLSIDKLYNAYKILDKNIRKEEIFSIRSSVTENILKKNESCEEYEVKSILDNIEKDIVRNRIIKENYRIDGRTNDMIRELDIRIGILSRTHGSALFTRGDTQALVTVTLGTERDAQNIDELMGERTDRFLLHYNFPPYCTGEIGLVGAPKRREIGHGRLAKRGMIAVMPDINEFPYTIRVVSEITESNGSSSMASVCGASLALMDAGVPIKSHIAGVSMGLIKEKNDFFILSDILGDEDHLGDMDFKIAGSRDGITALQMDIKIEGITRDIIKQSFEKAKVARITILEEMEKVISQPRKNISSFAPRIHKIKIKTEKIKDVIGRGGSVIKSIIEETGTTIEIEKDGTVKITSVDSKKAYNAIQKIREITSDIEIGKIYTGIVTRIVNFGVFVSIGKNNQKEGLVHISQIREKKIKKITDYLQIGKIVKVKILDIDQYGRIKLSIKDSK